MRQRVVRMWGDDENDYYTTHYADLSARAGDADDDNNEARACVHAKNMLCGRRTKSGCTYGVLWWCVSGLLAGL